MKKHKTRKNKLKIIALRTLVKPNDGFWPVAKTLLWFRSPEEKLFVEQILIMLKFLQILWNKHKYQRVKKMLDFDILDL